MSPHPDTLSWFRVNQSLLFLLNTAWLSFSPNTRVLDNKVFGFQDDNSIKHIFGMLWCVLNTLWLMLDIIGAVASVIAWYLDWQLPMQSVPIIDVVGWTPARARSTTLCDKVCQWLPTGRWFSSGPPVSSTNKTDRHDITEILLKVALNTIKPNQTWHYTNILTEMSQTLGVMRFRKVSGLYIFF
jgi:hypothetical protein